LKSGPIVVSSHDKINAILARIEVPVNDRNGAVSSEWVFFLFGVPRLRGSNSPTDLYILRFEKRRRLRRKTVQPA
jgi:hypothetical protein